MGTNLISTSFVENEIASVLVRKFILKWVFKSTSTSDEIMLECVVKIAQSTMTVAEFETKSGADYIQSAKRNLSPRKTAINKTQITRLRDEFSGHTMPFGCTF